MNPEYRRCTRDLFSKCDVPKYHGSLCMNLAASYDVRKHFVKTRCR